MASSLYLLFLVIATWAFVNGSGFYADNDQGQSVPLGKIDRRHKKEFQQVFLNMLGLSRKPKARSSQKMMQSASEFMKNLYKTVKGAGSTEYTSDDARIHISNRADVNRLGLNPARVEGAEVIMSFINNAQKASLQSHRRGMSFYFELPIGEQINAAELRMFKEVSPVFSTGRFYVSLYAIKERTETREKILDIESSLDVEWNRTGWLVLDVTKAACKWASDPYLNVGLYLRVVDAEGKILNPQDIGIVDRKGSLDKQSFLVGYMNMSREHSLGTQSFRNKRSTENVGRSDVPSFYSGYSRRESTRNYYTGSHKKCQRHNFYINFREIGFDQKFLIAPEGFAFDYCAGECSFPLEMDMNASNHAVIQTLVHLMNPGLVPKPCCVPNSYGTIPFLFFNDTNTLKLKYLDKMSVKSCGCF